MFATGKSVQGCYHGLEIEIISPENKIYAVDSIPLILTINKAVCWISYSLDGQENVTISGNDTLTNLSDGPHDVIVYAKDACCKIGVSNKVCFGVDTTPPDITDVVQIPNADNVFLEDAVKVNATITDNFSGVKQATLNYTNGNGTWITANMTMLEGDIWNGIWNATIPAFEYRTWVNYTITAEDNVGNMATTEVYGYQNQDHIIPEFSRIFVILLPITALLLATSLHRKRKRLL